MASGAHDGRPIGGVLQEQAERRDRALRVVAAAAVGRQVAEHGALARIARGDARRGGHQLRPRRLPAALRRPASAASPCPAASASACGASGSRSVESCSAVKPRISVRPESWQARHSSRDGMLCDLPGATSATRGEALGRGQHRVALVLGPRVGGELPAIGRGLHQHPGLDLAAAELELLPEARARPGSPSGSGRGCRWRRRRAAAPSGA